MHSFDYSSKNGYSFGGGSLWTPWPLDLLVVGGVKLLRPTRKPPGNPQETFQWFPSSLPDDSTLNV